MGSMREVRVRGEADRSLSPRGGGVAESARGLLYPEGEGEAAGEECSPLVLGTPSTVRTFSSSEGVLSSTSFRSVDKNDGTAAPGGGDACAGGCVATVAAVDDEDGPACGCLEDEASALSWWTRLVLGRLSFRSGSGAGSRGDAVVERDLRRLRGLGVVASAARSVPSAFFAISRAPQASFSSGVS